MICNNAHTHTHVCVYVYTYYILLDLYLSTHLNGSLCFGGFQQWPSRRTPLQLWVASCSRRAPRMTHGGPQLWPSVHRLNRGNDRQSWVILGFKQIKKILFTPTFPDEAGFIIKRFHSCLAIAGWTNRLFHLFSNSENLSTSFGWWNTCHCILKKTRCSRHINQRCNQQFSTWLCRLQEEVLEEHERQERELGKG